MVLNNVTEFHKILIKTIRLRKRTSLGKTYVRMYERTGVTLNSPAIVMAGAENITDIITPPTPLTQLWIHMQHIC